MTSRTFLSLTALCLISALQPFSPSAFCADANSVGAIDRHALVMRHNPVVRAVDPDSPLMVGNGNFAFGCDITGMQTFAALYQQQGVPVEILSRWCWISEPNPNHYTLADASKNFTLPDGRTLPFATRASTPAGDWLRRNPRDLPLGVVALDYTRPDGATAPLTPADIQQPEQILDLWTGIVTSRFKLDGQPVEVTTACAPDSDTIALHIESPLVATGALRVRLAFPRGHNVKVKNTPALDWTQPESHTTTLLDDRVTVERRVYDTTYLVRSSTPLTPAPADTPHTFFVNPKAGENTLAFTIEWHGLPARDSATRESAGMAEPQSHGLAARATASAVEQVFASSAAHWKNFWETTAAVDFTGSTNPLAPRIEERIILSRYLMAVQMAGDVPPQETGLTCSSWYGKHNTEMVWWHAAHFALWGSDDLLERNLAWYQSQLPAARALAQSRGLAGARWAKMTGPEMRESPGGNPLIIWNQPHMIYLCELLYRNALAADAAGSADFPVGGRREAPPNPSQSADKNVGAPRKAASAILSKYRDLVLETADCMASMLYLDKTRANGRGEYVLGPPLWIAQEIYDQATSQNPSYELVYWRWALGVAQQWRERLGLPRDAKWDDILARLSPPPQKDGKYVALESDPDTWDNIAHRHDHPEMLMLLGFLPQTDAVDIPTMNRTLDAVLQTWDWETKIWGWDYPMIAMTAARLNRPADAVDVLMRDGPNNRYLPTGHCPQRSDEALPKNPPPNARKREIATYLPANGAFLSAVALMIAGWDGAPAGDAPGFPNDGTWEIRAEGLRRSP